MSIKTDNTQTLVNALAEIERLRGRCAELEYHADRMLNAIKADDFALYDEAQYAADKLLFDSTEDYLLFKEDGHKASEAWILRKQAESIEEMAAKVREGQESHPEVISAASIYEGLLGYACKYRNQADTIEKGESHEA